MERESYGADMTAETETHDADAGPGPVFPRVVCGINGSRASFAAASQAAVLAGPDADLELLAITTVGGVGRTEMAELSPQRAEASLARARALASDAGVTPRATLLHADDVTETLLKAAADHDLVAVGARGASRLAEILLGGRATALVHRAPAPVLVARPLPADAPFPGTVLVASDGSECSARAVEIAGRIAARGEARVVHLHVLSDGRETPAERTALARETVRLGELAGREPVVRSERGRASDVICDVARHVDAGLVIVGSRGRGGIKALGSVSEVVAHRARGSVLVVRSSAAPA